MGLTCTNYMLRAIVPALHRKYVTNMVGMFSDSTAHGFRTLDSAHAEVSSMGWLPLMSDDPTSKLGTMHGRKVEGIVCMTVVVAETNIRFLFFLDRERRLIWRTSSVAWDWTSLVKPSSITILIR